VREAIVFQTRARGKEGDFEPSKPTLSSIGNFDSTAIDSFNLSELPVMAPVRSATGAPLPLRIVPLNGLPAVPQPGPLPFIA